MFCYFGILTYKNPQIPDARSSSALIVVDDGTNAASLLVFGGRNDLGFSDDTWLLKRSWDTFNISKRFRSFFFSLLLLLLLLLLNHTCLFSVVDSDI